ncbi:MAG: DNA methyltransferase [Acidimicrobiales bacterium]
MTLIAPRWMGSENDVLPEDQAVHRWYRFVLAFPPHLVRDYFSDFGLTTSSVVLDPFCGTGTTLVEAKLAGIGSLGIEAAPMAHFASSVKTAWRTSPNALRAHAHQIAARCRNRKLPRTLRTLPLEADRLLLADSISPLPLHRVLVLREAIKQARKDPFYNYELLALARILPTEVGNLRFGPEVGVSSVKKTDVPVVDLWLAAVDDIATDLESLGNGAPSRAILGDSRLASDQIRPKSVDAVITSPPYPNEKDYTRTTRLESVLLGFMSSRDDLRAFKKTLMRSNTRTVYRDDDDDQWVREHPEIQRIAAEIEQRRVDMGKTSGFERMYHRVMKLYFGGMARHLDRLKPVLRTGARLAYVVGDQASYLRVMIRTGTLLADIAERQGYELERIDLFRTRPATATKALLREEVVVLRWPGQR